tara:strand:+ start:2500 stop:2679 length:180 start_codon:yes stop_codon:yes gene_type:complete
MKKTIEYDRMPEIFNEWVRLYAEEPDAYAALLDEDDQPDPDYGEGATRTFKLIEASLEA